jgi:hypothetical protein
MAVDVVEALLIARGRGMARGKGGFSVYVWLEEDARDVWAYEGKISDCQMYLILSWNGVCVALCCMCCSMLGLASDRDAGR